MKFKIKTASNGQYYCIIVASNGLTLFTSEMYVSRYDAVAAAENVKKNGGTAPIE